MSSARNKVIAGDYEGKTVMPPGWGIKHPSISASFTKTIALNKKEVASYELVTDEHRKSAASGVARGLVGGALLGPVGLLAGAMSAKNRSIYLVTVQFKDGRKSLLEIDDDIYKALVKSCFQ